MMRSLAVLLGAAAIMLAVIQPAPVTPEIPSPPLVERPDGLTTYSFCPQWRSDGAVETELRAIPANDVDVHATWWSGDAFSVSLDADRVGSITSDLRQGAVPVMLETSDVFAPSMRAEGVIGRASSGCASWPATSWAVGLGGSLEGETTTLVVMNPFPQAATVDINVYSEQGLEVIERLEGFSIPAGERREIDLSAQLRLRTHMLVVIDDPEGLTFSGLIVQRDDQLATAVAKPLTEQWYFPAPPSGTTAEVVVVNPAAVAVNVDIDHFAADGSTLSAEQLSLDRRSSVIVTVPEGTAIQVRADGEVAAAMRAESSSGLGVMTGITHQARSWALAGASLDEELIGVSVSNPGPTATTATYRFVGAGGSSSPSEFSVPAGASVYFEVRARGSQGILIDSVEPIVVAWSTVGMEADLVLDGGVAR